MNRFSVTRPGISVFSPVSGNFADRGRKRGFFGLDVWRLATELLLLLPPNAAHAAALAALRYGLVPPSREVDDAILACRVWNLDFASPIGLAAGFDKNAEAVDALLALGFGFVEAGTVTLRPQPGNPRPNLFRLDADRALINRLGFNNGGLEMFARRLAARRARAPHPGPVGANIGINRDSADPIADIAECTAALAGLADFLVLNLSSPNTPGLRDLQHGARLRRVIDAAMDAKNATDAGSAAPLLVKIAPDLAPDELAEIAATTVETGVDGIIICNTTVARPAGLVDARRDEAGGLSGPPLFEMSLAALAEMSRLTAGRIPLVGVGGVASGADAYAMIRAGASLVQVYTAFVYQGPGLVARIKRELAALLRQDRPRAGPGGGEEYSPLISTGCAV